MDIVGGLSALSQAVTLLRDLRDIDREVDEAAFKLKVAEIQNGLADAKIALADAKVALSSESDKNLQLLRELDELRNGDYCPKCRTGRMRLVNTEFHSHRGLGHFGVEDWDYKCDNAQCAFTQTRLHDPHGAVIAQAKRA
jgi:hypothetical protein